MNIIKDRTICFDIIIYFLYSSVYGLKLVINNDKIYK